MTPPRKLPGKTGVALQTAADVVGECERRFADAGVAWNPLWEPLASWNPEALLRMTAYVLQPWEHGVLPAKYRELIYVALDAATTHLYEPGARRHIRGALAAGATEGEVVETLLLASVLGVHSLNLGLALLGEEMQDLAAGE